MDEDSNFVDPCNEFMVNAEDVDEFPRQKEQYNWQIFFFKFIQNHEFSNLTVEIL